MSGNSANQSSGHEGPRADLGVGRDRDRPAVDRRPRAGHSAICGVADDCTGSGATQFQAERLSEHPARLRKDDLGGGRSGDRSIPAPRSGLLEVSQPEVEGISRRSHSIGNSFELLRILRSNLADNGDAVRCHECEILSITVQGETRVQLLTSPILRGSVDDQIGTSSDVHVGKLPLCEVVPIVGEIVSEERLRLRTGIGDLKPIRGGAVFVATVLVGNGHEFREHQLGKKRARQCQQGGCEENNSHARQSGPGEKGMPWDHAVRGYLGD